jgi:predicted permease
MLAGLWMDLRYAVRALGRSPGFTVAAVATLALGIGVNAGVFTVLNGVLFRDLPAPDSHELVAIAQTVEGVEGFAMSGVGTFSTAEYRAYRDQTQTLSGLLAFGTPIGETTLGGDAPQLIYGALVSCNYFDVLETPPALGRALANEDCEPGAAPAVVLGHELWSTTFSADTAIVGRTIELNRQLFTVVGIAAEGTDTGNFLRMGYVAPMSAEPLLSTGEPRYDDDRQRWLSLTGRRADGTALPQVRAELVVIAARLDQIELGRSTALTIERAMLMTVPLQMRGLAVGAAAVLMTAFGFVLLIACANVANLLLVRGTVKSQEIGIRLSLGASRARLVRQLLLESLLLSLAGGVLGSALALWSFQVLVALAVPALVPPELSFSFAWNLSPDYRVVAFAAALTLVTGVLFGLAPALHASKPDLAGVIKHGSASAGSDRRSGRLRGTLVGVQVALCMALMIGAGLLLRGLQATYSVDPGFDYRDVGYISFEGRLRAAGYGADQAAAFQQRLLDEVQALPSIEAVAYAMRAPLAGDRTGTRIRLPGEGADEYRVGEENRVRPGFFSVLGLPIVSGRTFTDSEVASAPGGADTRPAIVTEATARNLWPEGDAIGRTLLREEIAFENETVVRQDVTLQIVGVVADAQLTALGRVDPYYVYEPGGESALFVKSRGDFAATVSSIGAVVRGLDPSLVLRVLPLQANIGWWRGVSGTVTTLAAALGVLALVLSAVGIYGVVAYSVTRRYREIGIRMALGARVPDVVGTILRQSLRPVVVGAVVGLAAAIAVSRVLSRVLFGVSPSDPVGFGGAVLLVLGVAITAGLLAARPATRTDPMETLRYE